MIKAEAELCVIIGTQNKQLNRLIKKTSDKKKDDQFGFS